MQPQPRSATVAPPPLRLAVGCALAVAPWLLVVGLAGTGPPGYVRVLAAVLGAAVAVRLRHLRSLRRVRRGTWQPLRQTSDLVLLSFACGASVALTVVGATAALVTILGLRIIRPAALFFAGTWTRVR